MSTKAEYRSGYLTFFESATPEAGVLPVAPIYLYDDFIGSQLNDYVAADASNAIWTPTNTSTTCALVANATNGIATIPVDNTDQAELGMLTFGDQLPFSIKQGLIFETRAALHVLPTGAGGELVSVVFGLASAHNATADSVVTNAWFRLEGDANILWETDDNHTNDDDNDTGVDAVADAYHIFRIDCTDTSAVKFYIDGVLVGTGDMSGLTGAEDKVQPYFRAGKTKAVANASVGTLYLDYVRIWQRRS
jgi:hypothetical protein